MDLSGRDVACVLGLGREATSRVLAAGLAGPATVRGRTHLYAREAVEALASRPVLDDRSPLPEACAAGVLVARIDPRVAGPVTPPRRLGVGRAAVLSMLLATRGRLPMVTTVAGFVIGGADVVGVSTADTGHTPGAAEHPLTSLTTTEPDAWFGAFEGRRLHTGPGAPWLLWRCDWCPPIPRDRPRRRDDH